MFFLNLLSIKDIFIPLSSFDLIYKEGYYVSTLFIVNKYIYPQCFSLLRLREVVKTGYSPLRGWGTGAGVSWFKKTVFSPFCVFLECLDDPNDTL